MDNKKKNPLESISSHELLQQIQNGTFTGTFNPVTLPKIARQELVEVLLLRGQEKIAIARILKVTDRTIRRDVAEIWKRNAMTHDPEFTKRFVGELRLRTMVLVEALTRSGHSSEGKPGERNHAFLCGWRLLKELGETLQSLGYLPSDRRRAILKEDPERTSELSTSKSKKEIVENRKIERFRRYMEAMRPVERDRFRKSLEKQIMEVCLQEEGKDTPPSVPTSEIPPPKDDEDPGASYGAAT